MAHAPTVGPHEGKELALMLSGRKNVALFCEADFLPNGFLPYIQNKTFLTLEIEWRNTLPQLKGMIVYRPTDEPQALRLSALVQCSGFNPDIEREIGHILGYRDIDIEYFITCFQRNLVR